MKTRIAIVTMLLSIFIAGTAMASVPVPATKAASKAVTEFLTDEISYPAFASENNLECVVVVSLIVQEDGTFVLNAEVQVTRPDRIPASQQKFHLEPTHSCRGCRCH